MIRCKPHAGDYERDPESGLLLPRREMRARPQWMAGPAFFGGSTTGDPYFSSVMLLLTMDGTNGSTTFVDRSSFARTVTSNNSAAISTSSPKFGTGALNITASNQSIQVPLSPDFNLITSDFTIEFWYRPANVTGNKDIYANYTASPANVAIQQRAARMHILVSFNGTSWAIDQDGTADTLTANTWSFVQLVRASGVFNMWVDGALTLTNSSFTSSGISSAGQNPRIGNNYNSASGAIGMIDDFRYTKGVARANAVPTAAFPTS